MSIQDSEEKINPVKDREGSQRPSVFNGVKQFIESEQGKNILFLIILILVGSASFELGRLSKGNSNSGIKIQYPDGTISESANAIDAISNTKNINLENKSIISSPQTPTKNTNSVQSIFFASKRGHKYYPETCSAGKTIKKENRVYFGTKTEAEKAGYTLSSSCK